MWKPSGLLALPLFAAAVVVVAGCFSFSVVGTPHPSPAGIAGLTDGMAGVAVPKLLSSSPPTTVAPGLSVGPTAGSSTPASISLKGGWDGLDYRSSCTSTCFPADPDVATGNGYVFEVTNTEYRIWTTNDTQVLNASLSTLFGTGTDSLAAPQVHYDPTSLRWFASVEDVKRGQIYYGGSLSSDPTGTWNIQHFTPPGGDTPTQPVLAVNALNLVVTTNLYAGSTFAGAQVWVANKTQLLAGGGVAAASTNPNLKNESLVPANPLGSSAVMYLVSDGVGGSYLSLFTLSGSPPGLVTLSGPVVFPSVTSAPPGATQPGTGNTVNVEDARVQSAVWNAGDLWASANVACTPPGDELSRSCLHIWELSTKADTKLQDFNWSTGAGTNDLFPAVAVDSAGDLLVVFEESSASLYPGVHVTAQTTTDPSGTLEPAVTIKLGTGDDNGTGTCGLPGICPFGNYSGAATAPLAAGSFWVVGEYTASDSATDHWHTWVHAVTLTDTYPVSFAEIGLPSGTSWSVTVNGVVASSTSPTITVNETTGSYTFTAPSPISEGSGTQFVASPTSGSFSVASASVTEAINFTEQFALSTSVTPAGAGTVSPSAGWFNANATVNLSALAGAGHAFAQWMGTGSGSYSGSSNPAVFAIEGPISEEAEFSTSVTYAATFTETGLPSGTTWSVVLNGVSNSSTGSSLTFDEPNGSYSYSAASPISGGVGVQYLASPTSGSFALSGTGHSQAISYLTQFEITTSASPASAGTVTPTTAWVESGDAAELSAFAGPGYHFVSWQGAGAGNYSGGLDPVNVSPRGPVTEVAEFSTVILFKLTTSVTPSFAGTVAPGPGSYDAGSLVELSAIAAPGYVFVAWQGSGTGNYTGALNPANVTIGAALTEVAKFSEVSGSSNSSTSSGTVPLWAFLVALGFFFIALVVLGLALGRRGRPPRTPPPLRPVVMPGVVSPSPGAPGGAEPWREG